VDSKTILKKLDHIDDLPTLPAIVFEVNKMLEDYDTSITKLSKIIEKDQAMVLKILKLVNSAFYGFRSKVSCIPNAIVLLGFNTVRNAIVSVSIIKAFSKNRVLAGFDFTGFWKHSIAVAVTSRHLAEQSRIESGDNCFVGGLLHDIGKVVLCHYFQDLFEKVWMMAQTENLSFYEAEQKGIPVGHARIGGYLAKKWQLPLGLTHAIQYHHTCNKSANNMNLLMIIHAANIIVNSRNIGAEAVIDISGIHPDTARALAPQLENTLNWYAELKAEIESACEFFLKES